MEFSNKNIYDFKLPGLTSYGMTFSWEGGMVPPGGNLWYRGHPLRSLLDSPEDWGTWQDQTCWSRAGPALRL